MTLSFTDAITAVCIGVSISLRVVSVRWLKAAFHDTSSLRGFSQGENGPVECGLNTIKPSKTAEPIKMLFGVSVDSCGYWECALDRGFRSPLAREYFGLDVLWICRHATEQCSSPSNTRRRRDVTDQPKLVCLVGVC